MAERTRRYNVNEVLDMVENDEFASADIFIMPSDGELTDEDSGDEEGGDISNLNGNQLLSEAVATLIPVGSSERCGLDGSPSHSNRSGSSDAETPSSDTDVPESDQSSDEDDPHAYQPKNTSEESMRYAQQKGNHTFKLISDDIRLFIAILLTSGYNHLPRRRMYWEQNDDVNNAAISGGMPRDRFEEIMRYFHVANNNNLPEGDKFGKLRPLFTMLNQNFLVNFVQEQCLNIDESMVPYYGRHGAKQFIRGKPIRFGYKVWCLNTRFGYLIQCEPYQGANTCTAYDGLGMGGSVVMDLMCEMEEGVPYKLYFDNLFTSVKLIDKLSDCGIGATGTIRDNRVEHAPLQDGKKLSKSVRGEYDFRLEEEKGALLVRWHDNSVVTVASNCHGVEPLRKAKRWSAATKQKVEINQPDLIHQYNTYMGGTDRMDQNIATYRISVRSKKWWWPLLAWLLDVSVQNAWLVYRKSPTAKDKPLDALEFRRHICRSYFGRYSQRQSIGRPTGRPAALDRRVLPDVRYDGKSHLISVASTQRRCGECGKNTLKRCDKCDIGLHDKCFVPFHTK